MQHTKVQSCAIQVVHVYGCLAECRIVCICPDIAALQLRPQ